MQFRCAVYVVAIREITLILFEGCLSCFSLFWQHNYYLFSANVAIMAYCVMCARQTCKVIAKSNIASVKKSQPLEFGWILTLKPSKTNYLIQKKESITRLLQGGESAGVRTRDPNIKSVVLYRLSYGFSDSKLSFWWCKDSNYFNTSKKVDKNIVCVAHI